MTVTFVPLTLAAFEAVCLSVAGDEQDAEGQALPVDPDEVLFGEVEWPVEEGEDKAAPLDLVIASARFDKDDGEDEDGAPLDGKPIPLSALGVHAPAFTRAFVDACRAAAIRASIRAGFYAYRAGAGGGEGDGSSLARIIASFPFCDAQAMRHGPIEEVLYDLSLRALNASLQAERADQD